MEIEQDSNSRQHQISKVEQNTNFPEFQKYLLESFKKDTSKTIIDKETKLHGKGFLMSLGLVDYEINKIVGPCLASPGLDNEVRGFLENKRRELDSLQKNLLNMFTTGKLNVTSYLYAIEKMVTANTGLLNQLASSGAEADVARVKKRLDILRQEKEKFQAKANQLAQEKRKDSADMSASGYFSKIEKLSSQELAKLLQIRIPQYWALANFINEQIVPSLSSEEQMPWKERLQNYFHPLVTKASDYLQQLQGGVKTPEITTFIRKEILDLNPDLLHGKSLEERQLDLQSLIELVEECIKEESDYINILKATLDDPDQVTGTTRTKIKESEKAIQKYQEYIEYLSKLGSQKFAWVPTPKIGFSKEQRLVNLINNDVPGNSLQVVFKRLNNIERGSYWVRWGVETHEGFQQFETSYCNSSLLTFEYKNLVEMTSKTRMDQTIEKKEITVEVLFKKFGFLKEVKVAYGAIPLAGFQNTNTLEGKVKLNQDTELYYVMKIRQPLMKSSRIEVKAVHTFKTFPIFNKETTSQQSIIQNKSCPPVQSQGTGTVLKPNVVAQNKVSNQVAPSQNTQNINPNPVKAQTKIQEEAPVQIGLLKKKTYPPLVLLKQDKDPLSGIKENEIPEGFSLDQILNPNNPDLIESITALQKMSEELEKARTELAGEGRKADNKTVSENWTKSLKKAMIMQAKFEACEIEPEQYLEQLQEALKRDKKLSEFYQKRQDGERLAFIREKIRIVEQEAKELKEGLEAS